MEANKEADELLNSKKLLLGITGSNVRVTENEALQAMYNFTKD